MRAALTMALGLLTAAGCAGGLPSATGTRAVPDPVAAILKTAAVTGARAEIARESGNIGLRQGIYLDTLVGPTPQAQYFEWAHPRAWLETMVTTGKVDGLFGVPTQGTQLARSAFALEVGEPSPAGGDTVQIVYAWCLRNFPTTRGSAGPATSWRDLFVRADTGWNRVGHFRAQALSGCAP